MEVRIGTKLSLMVQQLMLLLTGRLPKHHAHTNSWNRCCRFTSYTADVDVCVSTHTTLAHSNAYKASIYPAPNRLYHGINTLQFGTFKLG